MTNLTRVTFAIFALLLTHMLAIVTGWYEAHEWFDIPMHFAGGVIMTWLALALWHQFIMKLVFKPGCSARYQVLVQATIILGFVALIGIVWEGYEWVFVSQAMTLGDTLADLWFDLFGAVCALATRRNHV